MPRKEPMYFTLLAHVPVIFVTRPGDDWCAVIDEAVGGDIVMLEPGTYEGGCDIEADIADKKGERTILQSFDPSDQAVIVPPAGRDAALSVRGERLVLLQLVFTGGTSGQAHVDVRDMSELTVRRTTMSGGVDAGVRLVGDAGEVLVDSARFTDLPEALDLDCCSLQGIAIDRTVVSRGSITVGTDVPGSIRDSTIYQAPGTALTWGATPALTIDGAILHGSDAAVLGGSTEIRTSFLVGSARAISATGPADVLASTLIGTLEGPLALTSAAITDPAAPLGPGSVRCTDPASCWESHELDDLTPRVGGALDGMGVPVPGLDRDWCAHPRAIPPTAGALEAGGRSPGPLEPLSRGAIDCEPVGGTTTPTDTPGQTGDTAAPKPSDPPSTDAAGCGCGSSEPPVLPMLTMLLLGRAFRLRLAHVGASRSR